MAWIDYKKYSMVFKMYKTTDEVIKFIEETLKDCKVKLTEEEKNYLWKNSERYIQGRCTITINICNRYGSTQSHT